MLEPSALARGERLDRYLAQRLGESVSRSRVQDWISRGAVRVDGAQMSARHRLSGFERIEVEPLPRLQDAAFEPDPISLHIVHEDAALLVVDKPAGLVVHPAAGNWRRTLLNGLLHCRPEQAHLARAGIVHRLDKDTSGLMVVAKTELAQLALVRMLAAHRVDRRYLALAVGRLDRALDISAPIGRDPHSRIKMGVAPARGKPARTYIEPLAVAHDELGPVSLVHCRLETGRTHQIRVHMNHAGFPLLGDPTYGTRIAGGACARGISRQALHAWRLSLAHPSSGARLTFESTPPADFMALLARLQIDSARALARAARD